MKKLSHYMEFVWQVLSRPFRRTYVATKCGHKTKLEGWVEALGASGTMFAGSLTKGGVGPEYCLECLAQMSIRCAWCKSPICIGQPITLYSLKERSYTLPPEGVIEFKDGDRVCYVGCLRWNCAGSGADRAGFWVSPGEVRRVPTVYEAILAGGQGDRPFIVEDLGDPDDLGRFV